MSPRISQTFFNFHTLLIVMLLLHGCASIAKETTDKQVAKIEIGKSTKEDVLAILGLPHRRDLKIFEGNEIEFLTYYKGPGKMTVFMPVGIAPAGIPGCTAIYFGNIEMQEGKYIAAVFVFNTQGVVLDIKKGE